MLTVELGILLEDAIQKKFCRILDLVDRICKKQRGTVLQFHHFFFAIYRPGQPNWENTMGKFQDFSAT